MARGAVIDAATKARALELAAKVGPAAAARELGLKAGTVRGWMARPPKALAASAATAAASVGQASGEVPPDEVDRLDRLARAARGLAGRALNLANQAMTAGRSMDAQRYATVHGIAVDKANVLEAQLAAVRGRQVELAEAQAKLVSEVIGAVLNTFHGAGPASGPLVRHLLGQAVRGEAIRAPSELVEAAHAEAREVWAREVRGQVLAEVDAELAAGRRDPEAERMAVVRGLPAPRPVHPDGRDEEERVVARGELAAPVKRHKAEVGPRSEGRRGRSVTVDYGSDGGVSFRKDQQ